MFKFLMGIVTAALIVVAVLIWTSPDDGAIPTATTPADGSTTDPATADGDTSLTPKTEDNSLSSSIRVDDATDKEREDATPAKEDATSTDASGTKTESDDDSSAIRLEGGDTPGRTASGEKSSTVPMEELVIDDLDMRLYVPAGWERLDKNGMRLMLMNVRGEADPAEVERRVAPMIFWTVPKMTGDRSQPELIIEVIEEESVDALAVLDAVLTERRQELDDVQVLEGPRQASLGGFDGAMMAIRERFPSAAGDEVIDTQVWVFESNERHVVLTAPVPADAEKGSAIVDAIIGSVARLENG